MSSGASAKCFDKCYSVISYLLCVIKDISELIHSSILMTMMLLMMLIRIYKPGSTCPAPVRLPTASRPGHEDLMEPKTIMMMINNYGHLGQH